jgi:hypothetical protein
MRRDIYQAIADPTRRAILTLLTVGANQAQRGREIYYHLNIDKMKEIDKWLEQFRKIWESRFKQLDEVLLTIKKNKK